MIIGQKTNQQTDQLNDIKLIDYNKMRFFICETYIFRHPLASPPLTFTPPPPERKGRSPPTISLASRKQPELDLTDTFFKAKSCSVTSTAVWTVGFVLVGSLGLGVVGSVGLGVVGFVQ